MKTTVLKGHPLTEKESKEVKGGCDITPKNGNYPKLCPVCFSTKLVFDTITEVFHCDDCGGKMSEETLSK